VNVLICHICYVIASPVLCDCVDNLTTICVKVRAVVISMAVILSLYATAYRDFPFSLFPEKRYQRFPGGKRSKGLAASLETAALRIP